MSAKRSPDYESTFGSTIGSVRIRHWDTGRPKRFIIRARERPVENDAADGNPQRTRIPTAACKTLLGFAHFPQARRGGGHSQRSIFQWQRSTLEKSISCLKD